MKKLLLSTIAAISLCSAQNIEQIVNDTLSNNYDLKSIEKSIQIAKQEIAISKNWQNPVVSIGANDIWFDRPFDRDKEAMQAQFIGISQVIPINDKLDIMEDLAKKDEKINQLFLEDKKLELKSQIYAYVYSILVLEKKLALLNSYQNNVIKLEKLFKALYKYQKASQNEILNSKISFENINLKKQNLKNMIRNLYLKLDEISYSKINTIEENIDIKEISFLKDILTHPKIKISNENILKLNDFSKLEDAKKYSDIKVNFAYFQRDDKFKDYANVSVSIPLSIHDTENTKSLIAKVKANAKKDDLKTLEKKFDVQIDLLQNNLNNAYLNYKLIEQKIIPLKHKIQKNIENYNSFEKIKPQEMIKNLNELISIELSALDEAQNYYDNYSKLVYFSQKAN